MNNTVIWILLGVMLVAMLVLPVISQKRNAKAFNDMVENLHVGDKVRTIGGIIGRIIKINNKDTGKTILLETGEKKEAKTVLEFDVAAVGLIIDPIKAPKTENAAPDTETKESDKVNDQTPEGADSPEDVAIVKAKKSNKK